MGAVFMADAACLVLLAAAVAFGCDQMLLGAANLAIGISNALSGPAWGAAIPVTIGLLLLALRDRRCKRRRRIAALLGAKSRALLDDLVRRIARHAVPVPA